MYFQRYICPVMWCNEWFYNEWGFQRPKSRAMTLRTDVVLLLNDFILFIHTYIHSNTRSCLMRIRSTEKVAYIITKGAHYNTTWQRHYSIISHRTRIYHTTPYHTITLSYDHHYHTTIPWYRSIGELTSDISDHCYYVVVVLLYVAVSLDTQ